MSLSPTEGRQNSLERRARLAVLLAAVAFGTTGTAQALGPDTTTPLGVGAMRIVVGAAGLVAWVALLVRRAHREGRGLRWRPGGRDWIAVIVGGAGVALYQPAFFAGTDRSGVALGTIVALGSGPAFVGVWETMVLRRRPSASWLFATSLALVGGSILVVAQGSGTSSSVDAFGVICSLGAGLGYAVYASAGKRLVERGMDSSVTMAWMFAVGAAMLCPALLTVPLGWLGTGRGALMILHLGLVTVTLAYVLYGYGLRWLATSTVVTLTLAEPVTAALFGAAVLGERLRPLGWVGAAVVVAGLAITGVRRPLRTR